MKLFISIMLGLAIGLLIFSGVLLGLSSQINNLIQADYVEFAKEQVAINKQNSTLIVSSSHPEGIILDDPTSEFHQTLLIPEHPGKYTVSLVDIYLPSVAVFIPNVWNCFNYQPSTIKVATLQDADVSSLVDAEINYVTAQCNVTYQNMALLLVTQIAISALLICLALAGLKDRKD